MTETLDRVEVAAIRFGGIVRLGRLDQAAVVRSTRASSLPFETLLIENPVLVTRFLAVDPEFGLGLPIRVLSWQDADGKVWLRATSTDELGRGSTNPEILDVLATIETILGGWLDFAVSSKKETETNHDRHLQH